VRYTSGVRGLNVVLAHSRGTSSPKVGNRIVEVGTVATGPVASIKALSDRRSGARGRNGAVGSDQPLGLRY